MMRTVGIYRKHECSKIERRVQLAACASIEHKESKPVSIHMAKHKTRWCAGTCLICGEHMDVVTHYHAQIHGYDSAEDYIADGNVRFD
jgi:hypothetical protein